MRSASENEHFRQMDKSLVISSEPMCMVFANFNLPRLNRQNDVNCAPKSTTKTLLLFTFDAIAPIEK